MARKLDDQALTEQEIAEASAWLENLFDDVSSQKFSDYYAQIDDGTASEQDHDELYMRIIARFIIQTYKKQPVERWLQLALADAFTKIVKQSGTISKESG